MLRAAESMLELWCRPFFPATSIFCWDTSCIKHKSALRRPKKAPARLGLTFELSRTHDKLRAPHPGPDAHLKGPEAAAESDLPQAAGGTPAR
jgi:hypothetical protein